MEMKPILTRRQVDYITVATKLSQVLGRKWGVNIVFGHKPKTNGKTIFLPHWDMEKDGAKTALYGAIAHEAGGHIRQTNFHILANWQKRTPANQAPTLHRLQNICEDIRIEKNLVREYPGMAHYLNAVALKVFDPEAEREQTSNYWCLVQAWCLLSFRERLLGQIFLKSPRLQIEAMLLQHLEKEILDRAMHIGNELLAIGPEPAETSRSIKVAERLFEHFLHSCPKQEPQDDAEDQDSQNSNAPTAGQESDKPAESQSGDQQQDESDTSEDEASGKPLDTEFPDENDFDDNGDLFSAACEMMQSQDTQSDPGRQITVGFAGSGQDNTIPGNYLDMTDYLRQASAFKGRLIAALSPLLVGSVDVEARHRYGRSLNQRRLYKVKTDCDPTVFQKTIREEESSVAVSVLVDRSGSTQRIYPTIATAVMGIVSALDTFPQVETSVSHFPGYGSFKLISTKPFHHDFIKSCKSWPAPAGGTPLHSAMLQAGINMFASEKQRKIMLVVTDGLPEDVSATRHNRETLQGFGVEVFGVVIGTNKYPLSLFDDSEQIADVAQLPEAMRKLVLRTMR